MTADAATLNLRSVFELDFGQQLGQLRAAPLTLADGQQAIVAVYAADFDVDPYIEMFFFPTDTPKLAVFTATGELLWTRDLGRGVVPGMWFLPVLPFDLDGDGVDEIWFVNNTDPQHPLGLSNYVLERVNPATGQSTGQWPWPNRLDWLQTLSHRFRHFLVGGHVRGEPVLITAQGTYQDMALQAWRPDMSRRWEHYIPKDGPGGRGSHMCPIVDLDGDGVDHLLWGERCLSLDTGQQRWCADEHHYNGHSDVIQPFFDPDGRRWLVYTTREGAGNTSPRVACFDDKGRRVWGAVDRGHMDMGWIARVGPQPRLIAMAIRIGKKTCGPDGRFHSQMDRFLFDAVTGEHVELGLDPYRTVPVDLTGSGSHVFVRGLASGDGKVFDETGRELADIGGPVALTCKLTDHGGEQLLSYHKDGVVRMWANPAASDSDIAARRFASRFYRANRRLTATGSNLGVTSGA